jgi:hypothetical protein
MSFFIVEYFGRISFIAISQDNIAEMNIFKDPVGWRA